MPRRPALITQADVSRAIRAVQAVGLDVAAVVVRPDGVSVETRPSNVIAGDRDRPSLQIDEGAVFDT